MELPRRHSPARQQGRSNAELADQLYVSEATIKTHVSAILRELAVRDRYKPSLPPTKPASSAPASDRRHEQHPRTPFAHPAPTCK